ncbi:hypothetical protein BJV82DRAFT_613036 [Fennellomyces sp. T-0311]|nr:hypothetical protein BJV82DRAFT_613036 [Fennellomyces sp. T-0311]
MLDEIQTVIDHRDDGVAIELTSTTIGDFQGPKVATVLPFRTYTRAIQGNYDDAVKDAQDAITKNPTAALGYLRLGSLYQMQGKQQSAINMYVQGLQSVSVDDRGYTLMLEDKAIATKQNEKRVDFITKLPIEVVDQIMILLPLVTKLNCLGVSARWKSKILGCEKTWCYLEVTDAVVHDELAAVISTISTQVGSLVIKTKKRQILETLVSRVCAGSFSKVKSLEISFFMTPISSTTAERISNAFHQINTTLTSLVLSYSAEHRYITFSDILASLPNLRSLVYSTPAIPFTTIVGTFPLPKPHYTLVDLDLNAGSIGGPDLIPVLQACPRIAHMAINRCNNSVLDIVDSNCPNLKKLVYNVGGKCSLAPCDQSVTRYPSGLQEFSVWQHQSLDSVLDLLRRNTKTLTVLDLNITKLSCEYLLVIPYQDMEFTRLEKITFQGRIDHDIPQLILQWISNCRTLTDINASDLYGIADLAQVLVNRRRLVSLSLKRLTTPTVPVHLSQLFRSYAAIFREKEPPFQNIALQFCRVNRDVFCALSSIKTLKSITLSTLDSVSSFDLDYLFGSLGESTTDIHLDHMDSVADQHLSMLGSLKGLRNVHLEFLRSLTDTGVMRMTDNAPLLDSLTIKYCGREVTSRSIVNAQKKIKTVVFKSLYS